MCPPLHGAIAPSASDFDSSGTMSSGSTSSLVPSPVQSGQAPHGELNENERGSSSSKDRSSYRHARCSEYIRSRCWSFSGRSTKSSTTTPPDRPSAVSTESVSLRRAVSFTASRSTITSMSCFSYFFSAGSWPDSASSRRTTVPSTRAREYPLICSSLSSSPYSPLRPRTTGASTWNRVPSSSSRTRSTNCCGICLAIGRPQIGQCGLPILAYSSRR